MYESDLLYLAIMLWTERYSHPLLIKETWEDGTILKEKKQGARVLRLLSSLNLEPQMQCLFPAGSQTPGPLTRAHVFLGTRTGCIFGEVWRAHGTCRYPDDDTCRVAVSSRTPDPAPIHLLYLAIILFLPA